MINADLLWYLLVPVFLSAFTIFILHKCVPAITWIESIGAAVGGLLISALIISASFYAGKGSKTSDTQILNGEVLSKERVHGSYIESYQCNCHTVTSGSGNNASSHTECDTCYRNHYTVNWNCNANIGKFTIDSKDWTNTGVYFLPDPNRYIIINKGDPVSKRQNYTNYIKAVPETLFRPLESSLKQRFINQIPSYPIEIYDYYHIDRVFGVGVNIPSIKNWNAKLATALKKLGPQKQANVVIVITKTDDPSYFYALQDSWLGGKKNDIVVVIGSPEFPNKATWVNVMALSQDNIFQVKLRDDILALESLTADNVIDAISTETMSTFKRKRMRDFAYLDAEIDPPAWVMWTCMILDALTYVGFWIFVLINRNTRRW